MEWCFGLPVVPALYNDLMSQAVVTVVPSPLWACWGGVGQDLVVCIGLVHCGLVKLEVVQYVLSVVVPLVQERWCFFLTDTGAHSPA